jgi:cytochrome c biogenesis protein CcdA
MSTAAILTLGFVLGMRHATDSDHVVAVSAIISRDGRLRAAIPVGLLWGVGHTFTIFAVGSAIILFGIVIPPYVGLGLELCVALMLVLLGGLNIRATLREDSHHAHDPGPAHHPATQAMARAPRHPMRAFAVGVMHGLAGSAAIALFVLGAIRDPLEATGYLAVFGFGTIAGMLAITVALALSMAAVTQRFVRFHGVLGLGTGLASVALGALLVYRIGFVHGLFTGHPDWVPE